MRCPAAPVRSTTLRAVDTARLAAPEIDRLVLAVNRAAGDGDAEMARRAGLGGPGLVKHFADWLLTVGLQRSVAVARLPYVGSGVVAAWLDEMLAAGLVEDRDGRLFAVGGLVPLAESVIAARSEVANRLWAEHAESLASVLAGCRQVADAAPAGFVVGVAHREIPEPDDRALALHQRLVTLRYLRSHCHVLAWNEAQLTSTEIVAMTALWNNDRTIGVPGSLVQRGYAEGAELTEEGELIRGEIEYVTNQCIQPLFDSVTDPESLVERLRALPTEPDELD